MTINFSTSPADALLLSKIVDRAAVIAHDLGVEVDRLHLTMDLTAAHANGCALKLEELLGADRPNFVHDVWGIMKHIDRNNGQLRDCFLPRFAAKEDAE